MNEFKVQDHNYNIWTYSRH